MENKSFKHEYTRKRMFSSGKYKTSHIGAPWAQPPPRRTASDKQTVRYIIFGREKKNRYTVINYVK